LIPGVTDDHQNMTEIAKTVREIPGLIRVDLLPYHNLAGAKYPLLGLVYRLGFDESREPQVFGAPFDEMGIPWRLV
jgi:pyruvate formate lyase activating enzyme